MSALSFFQPAYLWALGFLAAILVLHFFRRRVIKRMDISTLRFLPQSAVSKSRVKRLMDILLLLARLLLVAALVLIFSGLHDKSNPLVALSDPRTVVYIWVDPTMSMEFAEGGKTSAGERATGVVDSLKSILPAGIEQYRFDHESGRFVLSSSDKGTAAQTPNSFAGRFGPPNIEEAVNAFITASSSTPSAVLMLLSDFQRGTTAELDSLLSRIIDDGKKAVCISFTPPKPYNYSVNTRMNSANKNEVTAVVRAFGAALDTSFVELTVGDLRIGQRSVACPRDDSVLVTFDMPPAKVGSWGKIELHAADPLPFDNRDYFTISAERGRTVLIVGNTARNKVIEAVLRASDNAFWNNVIRKDGGDLSYEDLNSADLVIVNNFNGRSRILESFISGAGSDKGIIITLDPDREDDFGRAFLRNTGIAKGALNTNTIENGTHPVLTDINSALWRGFPALSSGNSRVYRHVHPIPGDALVRLGNSRPLVSYISHSGVDLMVISTPLGISQANNLCETGFFVPFVDRLSRYALAGRGHGGEAWYAGHAARNPFFGVGRTGTLYDHDGKLVASWAGQPFVKIDRPGVYSLVSSTGETTLFTVAGHPSESEMIFVRPDARNADGIYYFEYGQFLEQAGNLSNNIWSYRLWMILGLVLCCEVFLWKRQTVKK